jgi:hypothetical protein
MKTLFAIAATLFTLNLSAQVPGGSQGSFDAQFVKLFGNNTAFSAKSEVHVFDKDKKESAVLTMDVAMLNGNMRNDVDMANIKSKDLPAQAIAQMKAAGMDRVVSIVRKDTKMMYVIYPNMKASAKMALSKEQSAELDKDLKMQKTPVGQETIDGHPCQKNKVVFTDSKGQKKDALVWSATDLKDFPLRVETKEQDTTVQMNFKQVQLVKPDANLFESPKGFKEYDSIMALQMAAMQKMTAQPK